MIGLPKTETRAQISLSCTGLVLLYLIPKHNLWPELDFLDTDTGILYLPAKRDMQWYTTGKFKEIKKKDRILCQDTVSYKKKTGL